MDLPVPDHRCNINHMGSSRSMESVLCRILLEEVNEVSKSKVFVSEVVFDDDSTLRSYCRTPQNGGELCDGVREPKFVVDPTHRTKVWVKASYKLIKQTKKRDEVKK